MPGRILVVDPTAINRIAIKMALSRAFFEVICADGRDSAREAIAGSFPDMVVLSDRIEGHSGYAFCAELKADPLTRHLPIFVLDHSNQIDWAEAVLCGADDIFTSPIEDSNVIQRLRLSYRRSIERNVLNEQLAADGEQVGLGLAEPVESFQHHSTQRSILWLNGDPNIVPEIQENFRERILVAQNDQTNLDIDRMAMVMVMIDADQSKPALARLAQLAPICAKRDIPILITCPHCDQSAVREALELGASDYICAWGSAEHIAIRIKALLRANDQAQRARYLLRSRLQEAIIDPLTGLNNRRYAETYLRKTVQRAISQNKTVVALMIDIDQFKQINDQFGHHQGDTVLTQIGGLMQHHLRNSDLISRFGGEEFLVLLEDQDLEVASAIAERLRNVIETHDFGIGAERISISVGIATLAGSDFDSSQLVQNADTALYAAKEAGRNQVRVHQEAA